MFSQRQRSKQLKTVMMDVDNGWKGTKMKTVRLLGPLLERRNACRQKSNVWTTNTPLFDVALKVTPAAGSKVVAPGEGEQQEHEIKVRPKPDGVASDACFGLRLFTKSTLRKEKIHFSVQEKPQIMWKCWMAAKMYPKHKLKAVSSKELPDVKYKMAK